VLVGRDLSAVDRALDTLSATRWRVRENLAWAFLYNAVAVPAAALGVVTPLLAAVAMAASSLLVVGNTTRSLGPESADDGGDSQQDSDGRKNAPETAIETAQPVADGRTNGESGAGSSRTGGVQP